MYLPVGRVAGGRLVLGIRCAVRPRHHAAEGRSENAMTETTASEFGPRTTRHGRSLWRRALFVLVICGFTYVLCEALAWAYISSEPVYNLQVLRADQRAIMEGGAPVGSQLESLHPYAGWVLNPQVHSASQGSNGTLPVNRWGLYGDDDDIPTRSQERLIVGVAGGSVAWQMTRDAEETFVSALRQDPRCAGKQVQIIRLAMPGYKQPQQLTLLCYLLSLGFEFDVLINIDGYNEVALPICENLRSGVALAYPKAWHARMQDVVDPRQFAVSRRLLDLRARRQELAHNAVVSAFAWSPLRNLIWKLQDVRVQMQLNELAQQLIAHERRSGRGFAVDGPAEDDLSDDAADAQVVALWQRSSRQLHHLCQGNGIQYLHCLQPNQYLAGSKPLSDYEKKEYFDPEQCSARAVNRLYPELITSGKQLRSDGIAFHDLTQLFNDIDETIYADYYCHYNNRGNELLAEAVAGRLSEAWSGSP